MDICDVEEVGLQLFEEMVAVCGCRWGIVFPALKLVLCRP